MSSIRLIGRTITVCKDDFAFLIFLFVLITIFYSTCVYMLEEDNFHSIPASMWWSAITMTTVGYGDFCPKTNMARVRTKISSGTPCTVLVAFLLKPSAYPKYSQNCCSILFDYRCSNIIVASSSSRSQFSTGWKI